MNHSLRDAISLGVLIAMAAMACATTSLTAAWKDPSYQGHPQRIMVIGVAKRPLIKRLFEDEFTRQIKARGTDAIASYTVIPDDKQSDQTVIAAKMKEVGADAVLITRLVSKKTVQVYVPVGPYYPPPYYGTWPDYYAYGYRSIYAPGYVAEDEYAVVETNLYCCKDDKLLWSASSETQIRGSDVRLIKSFVGVMVNAMIQQDLLG